MSQPLLGSFIIKDLWRNKLLVIFAGMMLISAAAVVEQSYRYRELIATLDSLRQQQDDLAIEWRHLLLEENALAEHYRVEHIARKQLNMVRPADMDGKIVEVMQ